MNISKEESGNNKLGRKPKVGFLDKISGEEKDFVFDLTPFLPSELVAGAVPYVAGAEEEAVWNAASQSCATEKVHFVYTVSEGKCWYIACPSSSLSSNPDSWCPLVSALPGNAEFWDTETVYLYEQEGAAAALRWDSDTGKMQLYIGASRTILPRIQSMEANFITINAKTADIIPWKNRSLKTEKLSRATAKWLLAVGVTLNLFFITFLAFEYFITNNVNRNLDLVIEQSQNASNDLMLNAYKALQSDAIKHMVRIQDLADSLATIDGTLAKYEVKKGGKVEWIALVPQAYSGGIDNLRGKIQPIPEKDGRARIKGTK